MVGGQGSKLARAIAVTHGLRPAKITELRGMGSVNHVFIVDTDTSRCVIRFAIDPLRQNDFQVESWALAQAAMHGIPSPGVVAEGLHREVPYLVQTFVDGVSGTERRSPNLWRTLGEYARTVHAIPVSADAPEGLFSRFGRNLPAAWEAHLGYNLDQLVPADPLISLGAYRSHEQPRLRDAIPQLRSTEWKFGLNHGDLSPRNLLVPPRDKPVLIDWGSACAGPVPFNDLLPLAKAHQIEDNPSARDLDAFADGYGISLEVGDTLEHLLLLSALDLVRWAIEQRPDLVSEVVASARRVFAQQKQVGTS